MDDAQNLEADELCQKDENTSIETEVNEKDEPCNFDFSDDNCIMNAEFISKINTIKPNSESMMLSEDQIAQNETVAKSKPGWMPVPYNEKRTISFARLIDMDHDIAKNTNDDTVYSYKSIEGPHNFSIYQHNILSKYLQNKKDCIEKYWDAFDIKFDPNWKEIIANKFNGITNDIIAIVRLLSNMNTASTSYTSMYIQNNDISSYISGEYAKYLKAYKEAQLSGKSIDRKQIQDFFIAYPESYLQDETYGYFASALAYAYYINENKPFIICEQIADYRHNGETKLLLSNNESKTEIRKEYNVFNNDLPEFVYTNYVVPTFICTYKNGYYIIRKYIHKTII